MARSLAASAAVVGHYCTMMAFAGIQQAVSAVQPCLMVDLETKLDQNSQSTGWAERILVDPASASDGGWPEQHLAAQEMLTWTAGEMLAVASQKALTEAGLAEHAPGFVA